MLNKAILMGRLTRDPELRYTKSNVPVVTFSLAVDRGFPKNAGEGQQTVDFINIVAWRNTAGFVARWFRKGQLVAVSGRIQARSRQDKDGNNRTVTEVVAEECFFADSKASGDVGNISPSGSSSHLPQSEGGFGADAEEYASFDELAGQGELPF